MIPLLLQAQKEEKKRLRAPPFNTPVIICAQAAVMEERGEIDLAESVLVINPRQKLTEQLEGPAATLRLFLKENLALDDDDISKKFKIIRVVHGKPTAPDARRTYDCSHRKADEVGLGAASSLLQTAVAPVSGVHLGKSLNGTELRVGVNPGPTQDEWEARSPGVHYNIGDVAAAAADGNVACHMDSRPAALSAAVGQKQHLEKPNKDLPSNATGGTILLIDTKPGAQRQVAFKNVQVSENGLFEPFVYKMHHFTKTGSGQT
jgi:hypothetical protein